MVKPKFSKATMRGGMAFLQRARNAIDGGFMYRPNWFDAAVQYQPTERPHAHAGNTAPVMFPEDKLMDVIRRNHPELWTNTIINLIPDAKGHIHYKHPAAMFLDRQKTYMAGGQTQEDAYQSVLDDWKRQRRFEKIELHVAMLQAMEMGALPPDTEKQPVSDWFTRRETAFQDAFTRRMSLEQLKRRERLEALLEARDAAGDTEPIDLFSLENDVTQDDIDTMLATDERAERHFGNGPAFDLVLERFLPEVGDEELEDFKDYLDQELTPEIRALLDAAEMPVESRAKFFRKYDAELNERYAARAAAKKEQEDQELRDRQELGEGEDDGEFGGGNEFGEEDDDDDDDDDDKKKKPAKGATAAKTTATAKTAAKTASKKKKKD